MSFLARQVVFGGVVPALVAGVLLIAGRRGNWTRECAWDAVAVAGGYLAGHFFVLGFPRVPVIGLVQALPFIVGLAAVWAFVDVRGSVPWVMRGAGRLLLSAATAFVLVQPALYAVSLTGTEAGRAALYAVVALAVLNAAGALAARATANEVAPAWLAATAGLSVCLLAARSGSLSQLAGALAGCLAAVTLMAFWRQEFQVTALAPVVALLWFSFSALGYLYGLSGDLVALLAGAAFLPGGVNMVSALLPGAKKAASSKERMNGGREHFLRERRISRITPILSATASLILSAGAVTIAFRRFGPPMIF